MGGRDRENAVKSGDHHGEASWANTRRSPWTRNTWLEHRTCRWHQRVGTSSGRKPGRVLFASTATFVLLTQEGHKSDRGVDQELPPHLGNRLVG